MTSRKPAPDPTPSTAEYAGAVSRFLDLAGITPEIPAAESKPIAEFNAFNSHLDKLAAENRRLKELEF